MRGLTARPLLEAPIVVLDTETTGLHPGLGHRVIEIGAVRLKVDSSGRVKESGEFNTLIQPCRPIDPQASSVNGIFDEDLVDAPQFAAIATDLLAFLEGTVLVAHNARFDADFLASELFISSLAGGGEHVTVLPNPWICTLQLARRQFRFGRNSLGHIAQTLGVRSGRSHRALSDVRTTAGILRRMARELASRGIERIDDLMRAQGGAVYATPPPRSLLPETLDLALAGQRPVRIRYQGLYGETERVIEPIYPTVWNGATYVVAYCRLRQGRRTFRVDRILSADSAD